MNEKNNFADLVEDMFRKEELYDTIKMINPMYTKLKDNKSVYDIIQETDEDLFNSTIVQTLKSQCTGVDGVLDCLYGMSAFMVEDETKINAVIKAIESYVE